MRYTCEGQNKLALWGDFLLIKRICAAVPVLLLCLSLCACGKTSTPSNITEQLLDSDAFSNNEKYVSLDEDQVKSYFAFDETVLEDFSVYVSSAEQDVTELGAFLLHDEEQINTVVDGISAYCKTSATAFGTIENGQKPAPRLLLMRLGNTVIYVISDNPGAAEEMLKQLGATEIN